jgi:hypothetical protein
VQSNVRDDSRFGELVFDRLQRFLAAVEIVPASSNWFLAVSSASRSLS